MKPVVAIVLFLVALACNAVLFLIVPTLQAAFHSPVAKQAPSDTLVRELAPPEVEPEKVVQREIKEIQMEPVSTPTLSQSRPSAPGGGLKLDLSAAGGEGLALVSGGDRSGPLGSGTGGGSGSGVGSMVYEPGQTDSDVREMSQQPVRYPPRAQREQITGYVDLLFVVNEAGFAVQISVIKEEPLGYGFAAAAAEAVRKYRFQPAMLQKTPVKQKVRKRVNFDL
jgi:TonB family protein